ncbi:DMT family transporter [Salipiger sp.]|uniref:DMT family transporter n=1 Tax=Salipiger sp. TaxID=2078585 RepID=UPI003A97186D
MGHNAKGALLALLSFGIYATHDVIVKFLGASYAPFQIVFFSVLLSFPLVTLMLIRDTTPGNLRPVHPWWTALRTGSAVITGLCAFYAFSVLPLAETYAILFAQPLLITVLSIPILGEQVRLRRWIAVLVGLAGVIVVLRPGGTDLTLGHAAALVAAVCGSLASIIVRKIGREERSVVLLLYPMLANFILMACALPFVYEPLPALHLGAFGLMALMAFSGGAILISAYRSGEAVIVAPMQYSQLIWAVLYGALFFDEFPDAMTLAGAGLIIGSGIYIVLREGRSKASENTPVLRTRSRLETGTTLRIGPWIRAIRGRNRAMKEALPKPDA